MTHHQEHSWNRRDACVCSFFLNGKLLKSWDSWVFVVLGFQLENSCSPPVCNDLQLCHLTFLSMTRLCMLVPVDELLVLPWRLRKFLVCKTHLCSGVFWVMLRFVKASDFVAAIWMGAIQKNETKQKKHLEIDGENTEQCGRNVHRIWMRWTLNRSLSL